ncbi:hypothetical protein FVO59_02600 [Microbacterium esteraromaticum]|uniref:Uncharacterized protein n=1 Tax=Microbacterium esteraromaticum TaxID=57043 RepID=A0A7D7W762_9MICO|nr:hypothetical protein [Microbacterium esteraromaticum]QMU96218.1 hypothetical protein FVO59_02600 [Microbacterium esteraromaticum]
MSRNPMAFPLSPQEVGALKARLSADPHDEAARRELVDRYRRTGDNDQAGRYAIAIDGLATIVELRAYKAMLTGLGVGADDRQLARLSRLPAGHEAIARARRLLDAAAEPPSETLSVKIASVAWWTFGGAVAITLIWTYFSTLSGDPAAQSTARILGGLSLCVLAVAGASSCLAYLSRRERLRAVPDGLLSVVAAVLAALQLTR